MCICVCVCVYACAHVHLLTCMCVCSGEGPGSLQILREGSEPERLHPYTGEARALCEWEEENDCCPCQEPQPRCECGNASLTGMRMHVCECVWHTGQAPAHKESVALEELSWPTDGGRMVVATLGCCALAQAGGCGCGHL